ncbi:MAG: hypothetical protein ABI906_01410 [Pseudomonadota bacterium]
MFRSLAVLSLALSAAVVAPPAPAWGSGAEAPNGKPQKLTAHRGVHAAPRSPLPAATPLADATAGLAKPYGGAPIDVTSYHYDNGRTGWNQNETDLTPASVASANFGLLKTLRVDGNVFPQPLLVSNFVMPDTSTHDVLIVATGHNTVYTYDARTYAVLWQVNLGPPQSTNDVGCGDVQPEYGISSTPVIVRAAANAATIFLVAATEPAPFHFHTKLHALSLATGQDIVAPVEISPSATLSDGSTLRFDPQNQWSRASLAYSNGSIYIGISSHCDNNAGAISGWLLRYDTNLILRHAFHTIHTPHGYELASIWMTGFAPAIDPAGNVFVVTGNGDFTGNGAHDYGESVLKLPETLASVIGKFTPADYQSLNNGDTDFGSGGVMLLPGVAGQTAPPLAVAMGKDAVLYLLDQTRLGGLRPNDSGALQALRLGGSGQGLWGGPAYYAGPAGPTVYAQINGDVLRSFRVSTGAVPALTPAAQGTTFAGYGGSLPIVSSNGAAADTGVVWLVRRSLPVELEAYDAAALGTPIFVANAGRWSNTDNQNPFVTPMVANGRVYAPAYKTVKVFGLTP